jgi:hypothetical protein
MFSSLDQNHGEVRIRVVRRVRGTLGNPALERRRRRRWECRRGISLASGVDGTYRFG